MTAAFLLGLIVGAWACLVGVAIALRVAVWGTR